MAAQVWLPSAIFSVSVVLALAAFLWQVGRARFNQSIDLLFKLEADFFGPAKKQQRVKAAKDLLEGKTLEAEPILDFFETMALLLRRGALDQEMVAHTFFYWIDLYYAAAEEMIAARQASNPLVWKDLSAMVVKLRQFEAKQRRIDAFPIPTPDAVSDFLDEELTEAT